MLVKSSQNTQSKHYYGVKTYIQKSLGKDLIEFIPKTHKKSWNSKFKTAKTPRFTQVRKPNPYRIFKTYGELKNFVILGVGGNCGETLVRFWKLLKKLSCKNVIISTSPILKNPAFGYTQQPDFYNMIIWIKTRLGIADFWSFCAYLERYFGRARKRPFKNAPRTLDLDIIAFKDKRIVMGSLEIPHRAWSERESVWIPLIHCN
ncbi:2-amino-4-hydroxy-6-hydroxymethyldihydropteridine diphosphokinase [Helicobacter winghamensis]|uniref:2-amino-4-hydroxy-6- hydroxymethyldihydropteridine diphosphokinase n=1 Tax=Helicobacter winghamensis TaxID=157268 RepID=UPI0001A29249|nr:2-amino-4-hydroxy-6-hydroxymethyldihydropteridine diphosphokinase [Helicobacter winghamensis]EEO25741.1 2-amino-4-hydroxy-6-hydroxymethyldihydropteridine diphosphokinase [Helicobacter winghamensis ATCC BAA-430]QOQ98119.1 2-amino-4-hydroxy-6-hydroxymethyldihydropteridine diphosphokinase [Helicobacter winghamensis]